MAVFFDRFLASVEAYRIPAILVFNKIDLYDEEDLLLLGALTQIYMQVGYEMFARVLVDRGGDGGRGDGLEG